MTSEATQTVSRISVVPRGLEGAEKAECHIGGLLGFIAHHSFVLQMHEGSHSGLPPPDSIKHPDQGPLPSSSSWSSVTRTVVPNPLRWDPGLGPRGARVCVREAGPPLVTPYNPAL